MGPRRPGLTLLRWLQALVAAIEDPAVAHAWTPVLSQSCPDPQWLKRRAQPAVPTVTAGQPEEDPTARTGTLLLDATIRSRGSLSLRFGRRSRIGSVAVHIRRSRTAR